MGDIALEKRLRESGNVSRQGDYCGAQAVLSIGTPADEFNTLRTECGVISLTWRERILLTGPDRVRWLNGMVTNNIRDLAPGRGVYAFFLNPQGRIQADMYCFNRGDDLLVETDASQAEALRAAFDKFIIMDEVEVAVAETVTKLAVVGPKAPAIVEAVLGGLSVTGIEPLELHPTKFNGVDFTIFRLDDPHTPSFEIWIPTGAAADLVRALLAAGATQVGADAVEMLRIWSGRPRYGQDIRDRDLPQETAQDRALHYNKGCYVGQEIVERIHARGNVHRIFTGFAFEGGPPPAGSKIEFDGKEVGEITSSATIPGDEGPPFIALGYIRREAVKPGAALQSAGITGRAVRPPFVYVKGNS